MDPIQENVQLKGQLKTAAEKLQAAAKFITGLQGQIDQTTKSASENGAVLKELAPKIAENLIKRGFALETERKAITENVMSGVVTKLAKNLLQVLEHPSLQPRPVGEANAPITVKSAASDAILEADNKQRQRCGLEPISAEV
jgi:hypothetical protein